MTDIARSKLSLFGLKVILIEPSSFTTRLTDYANMSRMMESAWYRSSQEVRDTYGEGFMQLAKDSLQISSNTGQYIDFGRNADIKPVIDAIEKAVTLPCPRSYYRVTSFFMGMSITLITHLPHELVEVMFAMATYSLYYCGKWYPSLLKNQVANRIVQFLLNGKVWHRETIEAHKDQ